MSKFYLNVFRVILLMLCSGITTQALYAQHQIKGVVYSSEDGFPMPGVNLLELGTANGSSTDIDGNFSMEVQDQSQVQFSFMGFESQTITVTKSALDLKIFIDPSAEQLSEIVVTALGIKRDKKALGYAVQDIKGEDIVTAKEANVMSNLTGKVAGLVVNNQTDLYQKPSFSIRGVTPLIVIDGAPVSADMYDVAPDDIESISVLKGTTAAALYGTRGKNGAIMITTKSAKNGEIKINVSSSNTFTAGYVAIPEPQTIYGTGDNGLYAYKDGAGGGVNDGTGYIWGPKLDVGHQTTQYDSPIDPATGELMPTDWVSRGSNNLQNFLRTGLTSSTNVEVMAGNEKGKIRMSLSNMYQKGQVPNTKLNSTTFQ